MIAGFELWRQWVFFGCLGAAMAAVAFVLGALWYAWWLEQNPDVDREDEG